MNNLERLILDEVAIDIDADGQLFDQDFNEYVSINNKFVMVKNDGTMQLPAFSRKDLIIFDIYNWRSMDFMMKYHMYKLGIVSDVYVAVCGEEKSKTQFVKKTKDPYSGLVARTNCGDIRTKFYHNQALKYIEMILILDNNGVCNVDLTKIDGEELKSDGYLI